MRKATYPVSQLDLDKQNPRGNAVEDQTAALQELLSVEKDAEKIYALATSICEMGMLDPGDRLYVIQSATEPDRYIVLDGNRRLTSLRLLSQAALVDRDDIGISSVVRQRFKRLQRDHAGRWPTEVDVVVFESRQAADKFIRLRHTGENSGAGRSAWSAFQIARFDNTGTWQCLEQLKHDKALALETSNALDRGEFAITNFERIANVEAFQERFEYSLGSSFSVVGSKERAYKALSKVASDVVSGRVHSRDEFTDVRSMASYFDEVAAFVNPAIIKPLTPTPADSPGTPSDTTTPNPLTPDAGSPNSAPGSRPIPEPSPAPAPSPVPAPSPPVARKPRTSTYLIEKKALSHVTNQKCRSVIDELKGEVKVTDAPFACALLLRSFQEMTAYLYLEAMGEKPNGNRTTNIAMAANHLLGIRNPSTDPADWQDIAKAFKSSSEVYEHLSAAAHSSVTFTGTDHVRVAWKNLSGGLDLLWKRIHHAKFVQPVITSTPASKGES